MVAEPSKSPSQQGPPEKEPSRSSWVKARWVRFLGQQWATIILGLAVVVQSAFVLVHSTSSAASPQPSPESDVREVPLGTFEFKPDPAEDGRVTGAEFSLAVALLDETEAAARQRLKTHRFRVQQGIEQLLRQAHGGDFDDPTLAGVKRLFREQINETLGLRAIAEVIITDLRLRRDARPPEAAPVPATTTPSASGPSD